MKFKDMDTRQEESRQAVELSKYYLDNFREFSTRGASGFFSGGVGTGKTRLACIICENVSKMGFKAKYITAWQMIQDIRTAYSDKSTSIQSMVSKYILCDFLVIDEVGVQSGTNDERVLMYQVIDGRYNHVKSTILISNSKNPVKDGHLDQRTIDRLKEGGGFSMTFNGESYRR